MRKVDFCKATDNEIIVEYIKSYSSLCLNENLHLGTKQLSKHCADLEIELLARKILTQDDIEVLNK